MRRLAKWPLLLAALLVAGCGKDDPTGPDGLTILGCDDGQSYAIGANLTGTLVAADCREPGGSAAFTDYYEVVLTTAGPVSITLEPTAGPGEIAAVLVRPDESQVDFGFAEVGGTTSVGGDLAAGTYYLFVTAEQSTQSIAYTLSSSRTLPPAFGCSTVMPYTIGATVAGALAQGDCEGEGNVFIDVYRFTQATSGPVSLSLEPAAGIFIAAVAILAGSNDEVVLARYALPGSPAIVGGTLPAGNYAVIVIPYLPQQTGGYTLTSSRTLPPPPPPFLGCMTGQPYTTGTAVTGGLAASDCLIDNGYYMDRLDITLSAGRTITIDLASTDFDTYLMLFDDEGRLIAANDDASGATLDSRLTVTLPAGTYSIGASSYFGYVTGPYTLSSSP
jgi:hypothetical protein